MSFSGTSLQGQQDRDQVHVDISEHPTEQVTLVSPPAERSRRACRLRCLAMVVILVSGVCICFIWVIYGLQLPNHNRQRDCEEVYDVPNDFRYSWPLHGVPADVQKYFDQGMLLCFSFNHDEAVRSFRAALKVAPQEPMLHWGIAYSMAPNLNRPLTESNRLHTAQKAVHEMLLLTKSSHSLDAEQQILMNATAVRFAPQRNVTPTTWVHECDIEYWEALRRGNATLKRPSANFLAILGQAAMETDPWNYYELDSGASRMKPVMQKAYGTFRAALFADPTHPLALHYCIHLLEVPVPQQDSCGLHHVAETLQTQFRTRGPGHLIHMPSHAYNRLQQYHKGSSANSYAIAADADYFKACDLAGVASYNSYYKSLYFCHKHAVLLSSLQMEGRLAEALLVLEALEQSCKIDDVGDHLQGVFATYSHGAARDIANIRFGKWSEILLGRAKLEFSKHTAFAISLHHVARGMAFLEKRECQAAVREQIHFINSSSSMWNDAVFEINRLGRTTFLVTKGDILNVANLTLSARLAGKCGSMWDDELSAWRLAVKAMDALPYFEPAFWPLNPRLCLGERLRNQGDFKSAQSVFYDILGQIPDTSQNGWALFGLWKAIEEEGNITKAAIAEDRFKKAWQHADFPLEKACY